ncbi:uncharacterized protein LOC108683328 isoform X2 [Hyalella azteca]|uniref:Uncharacterized protein LOC108683328 isoform X2 n=1 Tax=Hyalella azteca TaxID=294128 RepID=A0A979FQV7_HYAAZ|nr:uncharacterized protein LOC108683328 isoform X2 [Hyalella azteca]
MDRQNTDPLFPDYDPFSTGEYSSLSEISDLISLPGSGDIVFDESFGGLPGLSGFSTGSENGSTQQGFGMCHDSHSPKVNARAGAAGPVANAATEYIKLPPNTLIQFVDGLGDRESQCNNQGVTNSQQLQRHQQLQQKHEQQEMYSYPQGCGTFQAPQLSSASNQLMPYNHTFKQAQISHAHGFFQNSCLASNEMLPIVNNSAMNSLFSGQGSVRYLRQVEVQQIPVANQCVTTEQKAQPHLSLAHSTAGPSSAINTACDPYIEPPCSPNTELSAALVVEECMKLDPSSTNLPVMSNFDPQPEPSIANVKKEGLPRSPSIDVMHLNDWPGDFEFSIRPPADLNNTRKWCYNEGTKRLYCQPNVAIEVHVTVNNWQALVASGATVRLCAVFTDPHHRTRPVKRCDLHCQKDTNPNREHLIQVDSSHAVYGYVGERQVVSVPLHAPPPGLDHLTLLVKSTCMTSCLGGPNRRPFAVLFSCMIENFERGRQILSIRSCRNPFRDMEDYKRRISKNHGLLNSSQRADSGDGTDAIANRVSLSVSIPDLESESKSDVQSALESIRDAEKFFNRHRQMLKEFDDKDLSGFRSRHNHNLTGGLNNGPLSRLRSDLTGGHDSDALTLSSDSETETTRIKRLTFVTSSQPNQAVPAAPSGLYCQQVEKKYEAEVVQYVERLAALDRLKNNFPELYESL